jgi:hypothetical protein
MWRVWEKDMPSIHDFILITVVCRDVGRRGTQAKDAAADGEIGGAMLVTSRLDCAPKAPA